MAQSKGNKASLDAKAYINSQVNKMREIFSKATDKQSRQELIKTFRGVTSSDEYKENLKIVNKDTNLIREYVKRKRGDITPEEFKDAKNEFYGKDMNLEFGEDFEKLDLGKKVDYIFEKFGDTDYAADLIIELFDTIHFDEIRLYEYIKEKQCKNNIMNNIFNIEHKYENNNKTEALFNFWMPIIRNKFGNGPVTLRLGLFLMESFDGKFCHPDVQEWIGNQTYENLTENTLQHFAKGSFGAKDLLTRSDSPIVLGCKDGSISNYNLLNLWIDGRCHINFKKLSVKGQKYVIDGFIKNNFFDFFVYDEKNLQGVINENINLGEDIDVVNYIFEGMIKQINDADRLDYFCSSDLFYYKKYHKEIANILIQIGKIDIVRENINKFTGLTELEKAEIIG